MFCPKCGTQNPEAGKFCRGCGTDLGNVSAVMSGNLPVAASGGREVNRRARRRQDPHEVQADAIRKIITGIGFLIVSMALLFTGAWGGHTWWWALLFPAFGALAKGIPDYIRYERMIGKNSSPSQPNSLMGEPQGYVLPPNQTEYIQPESRYKTGDLVPPSVTDRTTRHLDINSEGETMTLPKK